MSVSVIVNSRADEALAEKERRLSVAFKIIAGKMKTYAKLKAPVGTPESTGIKGYRGGTLRQSIRSSSNSRAAIVGTNVEYAPYVELGTRKMRAQPYLRPSIENHLEEYKKILENELQK